MKAVFNLENIKYSLIYLFIAFTIFVYFYTPNIKYIPISLDKFLLLFMLGWTILKRQETFLKILGNPKIFKMVCLYFLILLYTLALDLIVIDGVKTTYHVGLYLIQYIPFSICLFLFMDYYLKGSIVDKTIKLFIYIVFFQCFIGWIMFINPSFKLFIYDIQSADPENMYKGLFLRGNGFSSGLAFSIPLIHGAIMSVILFIALSKPKFSTMFYFFFCLSISLLNARIALIPILISLPFILIKALLSFNLFQLLRFGFIFILSTYLLFLLSTSSSFFYENIQQLQKIFDWIVGGYSNLFGFDNTSGKESIVQILLGSIHINTDLLPLLFGEGIVAFDSLNKQSDIGLVNLITFGGIFYLLSVHFVTYYSLYLGFISSSSKEIKYIIFIVALSYFAGSMKGIVFTEQILGRFLILIVVFSLVEKIMKNLRIRNKNFIISQTNSNLINAS